MNLPFPIPTQLKNLAQSLSAPLYVVGGSVRDFLCGYSKSENDFCDWDICAPVLFDALQDAAQKCGFQVEAVYKNTGTVKLKDSSGRGYEFTSFRTDKYVRGEHTPCEIYFTDDITLDAKRRDFTCNAIYYDIKEGTFVDPLGGMADVQNKKVRTVREPQRVFGEDGLRLLRLARQCAQLGFSPCEECLRGATENAPLINDISPERVYTELNLLLHADEKYGVKEGAYFGLCLLRDTGVLNYILPELSLGNNMPQRADFHKYDVLEHTFRTVLYSQRSVRWAALLHDVGKPYCFVTYGNMHDHPVEGKRIAADILTRLKVPKKTAERVTRLVALHMYDMDCRTKENKIRKFIVDNYDILDDLTALMQADFSACQDDLSPSPPKTHILSVLTKMQNENAPFTVKQLKIDGKTLLGLGITGATCGKILKQLLYDCAITPRLNSQEHLIKMAEGLKRYYLGQEEDNYERKQK